MKVMMIKGWIESPIDLSDEAWDRIIDKLNNSFKSSIKEPMNFCISELGKRENRP